MSNLVVARLSGALMLFGRRYMVRRGVTVAETGHPLVAAHPHAWEPLRVHYPVVERVHYPVVEQATAAPGELRDAPVEAEHRCDRCGTTAKSAAGLAAHKRSCKSAR